MSAAFKLRVLELVLVLELALALGLERELSRTAIWARSCSMSFMIFFICSSRSFSFFWLSCSLASPPEPWLRVVSAF